LFIYYIFCLKLKMNSKNNMQFTPSIDTCNEEIGVAPQSFGEMLDIDSFLKTITEEELYKTFLQENQNISPLGSVLPSLQTLPDPSPSTLYNPSMTVLPPIMSFDQKPLFSNFQDADLTNKRKTERDVKPIIKKQRTAKDPKVKIPKEDQKYQKRLEANKKSAQASRERKKLLRAELEVKLDFLTRENSELQIQMTQLATENKVLKNEFIQLQNMVNESAASKLNYDLPIRFDEDSKSNVNTQTAAALYLMVVLHSFGQHFLKNASADANSTLSNPVSAAV